MTMTPEDDDRTVLRPQRASAPAPTSRPPPPGESGNALPPGTLLGEFELTGVAGVGGFSIVYVAQDQSLHRRVAVKQWLTG